jgi:hypothetical protein
MGFKTSTSDSHIYYKSRIHSHVYGSLGRHSSHRSNSRNEEEHHILVICSKPDVYCKVFEDSAGMLELARLPKLHPCTKHINVCYHHFCEHVRKGLIKIFPVGSSDQIADVLAKALTQNNCVHHHVHCAEDSPPSYQSEGVLHFLVLWYLRTYFTYLGYPHGYL